MTDQNPSIVLNGWPQTLNNVTWSKDNIIAVGGSDVVTLLNYRYSSIDDKAPQWDKIHLRTSVFSDDEVPLQLPLQWSSFSIGEELSEAFVSALEWSPPGLAKHGRCVLAVLTSNHVLSLWECIGTPTLTSDWKRFAIVNHALQDFVKRNDVPDSGKKVQGVSDEPKIRQRIRAFAWSQSPQWTYQHGQFTPCADLGRPVLAVSNDYGEVFIVKIKSPYELLTQTASTWQVSVSHCFSVSPDSSLQHPITLCLPISFSPRQPYVDQLAWSPWSRDPNGSLASILTFIFQSRLYSKTVKIERAVDDTSIEVGLANTPLLPGKLETQSGAMRWLPNPTAKDELYLVYQCRTDIYCFVFHLRKAVGIRPTKYSHRIDWDEISGLSSCSYAFKSRRAYKDIGTTITIGDDGQPRMDYLLHRTAANNVNTRLTLPFSADSVASSGPWQGSLRDAEIAFSMENNLEGHVETRTYGIASSPLNDFLATNSSNHPNDGTEYVINADQLSILNLVPNEGNSKGLTWPTQGGTSHAYEIGAESVLFSFRQAQSRQSDHAQGNAQTVDSRVASMMEAFGHTYASASMSNPVMVTEDTPVHAIVQQLKEAIFFNRESIERRTVQLSQFLLGDVPTVIAPNGVIVRRIVTEVAQLPHFLFEAGLLSSVIMSIHCAVLAKLETREGRRAHEDINEEEAEKCHACGVNIIFESLRWARCVNHHQYTRCALTFMAIQKPGIVKSCGICNTQYLNEHAMEEFQHGTHNDNAGQASVPKQGGANKEPVVSLARILFAACDFCVACGGKFVG